MVKVAGTVASVVSLLVSVTVSASVESVLRLRVAVVAPAPAPSEKDAAEQITGLLGGKLKEWNFLVKTVQEPGQITANEWEK